MFYGNETVSLSNNVSIPWMNSWEHFTQAERQQLINASMVEGIPEFGGYSVPEEYGAFLMDKSLEMKSSVPEQQYGNGKRNKESTSLRWSRQNQSPIRRYLRRMAGGRADRHTKNSQAKADPVKSQEAGLFLTGIQWTHCRWDVFEEMLAGALIKGLAGTWTMPLSMNRWRPASWYYKWPALITVNKEASQEPATITYQNVVNMFSRLAPSCFTNAVWLANPSVIPQLLTMTITIGTGGAQIPVFREESGKFTLLVRRSYSLRNARIGAKGDLILADLSQYAIGMRKEMLLTAPMSRLDGGYDRLQGDSACRWSGNLG